MNSKFFSLFLLIFFLVSSVSAINIGSFATQADRRLVYDPGLEESFEFTLSGASRIKASVSSGVLSDFVTFYDPSPDGGPRNVRLSLKFPTSNILPVDSGEYVIMLEALDISGETEGSFIGSRAKVQTGLRIRFLNMDPDLKGKFVVSNINEGGRATYSVSLESWSYENSSVNVEFSVLDSLAENELLTFNSETVMVPSKESVILEGEVPSENLPPGVYNIIANVKYDGKSFELSNNFIIGKFSFAVKQVNSELYRDTIGKLSLKLDSTWTNNLRGLYAIITIEGLEPILTPNFDYTPGNFVELNNIFVDVRGFEVGSYLATIQVYSSEGLINEHVFNVDIMEPVLEEEPSSINYFLLIIVFVIILVLLVGVNLFFIIRKRGNVAGKDGVVVSKPHKNIKSENSKISDNFDEGNDVNNVDNVDDVSEVLDFISEKKKDGYSDSVIKSSLLDAGWSKKEVDFAFDKLNFKNVPSPKRKK